MHIDCKVCGRSTKVQANKSSDLETYTVSVSTNDATYPIVTMCIGCFRNYDELRKKVDLYYFLHPHVRREHENVGP